MYPQYTYYYPHYLQTKVRPAGRWKGGGTSRAGQRLRRGEEKKPIRHLAGDGELIGVNCRLACSAPLNGEA